MTETRSTHPIDIITDTITAPVMAWTGSPDAAASVTPRNVRSLAELAVTALTDDAIVANAVQALKDDGWEQTHEGPDGVGTLTDEDLANIARTVLGSVAGDSH